MRVVITQLHVAVLLAIACMLVAGCAGASKAEPTDTVASTNKSIVQESFSRWQMGTGGPFDLLTDDALWTIAGSSAVAKAYGSKEEFMAEVIRPFNARMTQPLKPTIRSITAEGDMVVVHFDARSLCTDGNEYRNTYAWFMQMRDGRAIKVTAFFDSKLFDEMWLRVPPRE